MQRCDVQERCPQGKRVRIVVDNKLKGAYAESDLKTGLIRVNKKKHTDKNLKRINPLPNGNEDLASTVQHELLHFKHPKARERTIRKMEKASVKKMSPGRKKQLLASLR